MRGVASKERVWHMRQDGTMAVRLVAKLRWSCDKSEAKTHPTSVGDCVKKAVNKGRIGQKYLVCDK